MRLLKCTLILALLAVPAAAIGQERKAWVAPSIGVSFGGDAGHSSPSVGVSAGWMVTRCLGIEADVADAPALFQQDGFLIDRRVTTVMGGVLWPVMKSGSSRKLTPYLAAGAGLFRAHIQEAGGFSNVSDSRAGFNVGGGVMGRVRDGVDLRGDIRYVRSVGSTDDNAFDLDLSGFGFWRASLGLVVRF